MAVGSDCSGVRAQVSAAITFIVGMFAVAEITLVSYLATPAKTQAVLLHNWALAHRRQVLVAILAVVGVWMVANSMGSVGAGG